MYLSLCFISFGHFYFKDLSKTTFSLSFSFFKSFSSFSLCVRLSIIQQTIYILSTRWHHKIHCWNVVLKHRRQPRMLPSLSLYLVFVEQAVYQVHCKNFKLKTSTTNKQVILLTDKFQIFPLLSTLCKVFARIWYIYCPLPLA